jgi:diaminohydroxyphosphoribosylaminopyrimidine deaminase/5-amino-6-(5-phosphoribosylamino)uracil reductase
MNLPPEIIDQGFMQMAYALAEKARGWASPNPYVGAVVVKGEKIVGYGYHEQPGKPHAEVVALRRAGKEARGSTLYVTLEPCVHWGRTPPCVETILRFRPKRVVISALDPNPIVYKKGVKKLKEAGIEVALGCLGEKNQRLNEAYIKYITQRLPWVILKAGLSMDGKIAAADGSSRWVTGPLAREYTHLLRGEADALLVGINTVIRDNPQLTIRHPLWGKKQLVRVILDSRLRLPLESRLLKTFQKGPILIFTSREAPFKKKKELAAKGAEIMEVDMQQGRLDLKAILKELARRGLASVLVEGGSQVLTSFLEQKLADKLFLHFAPRLLGGQKAPSLFAGQGFAPLQRGLGLRPSRIFSLGQDFILEGYL